MSLSFVAFAACEDKENRNKEPFYKSGTEDGHDYVDLGLPSGTKWATCNVGATNPQDDGNYYAWGEVTTKENYNNYKYYGDNTYTKYNRTDHKTILDPSDDAAYVNWGGKWRMPTYDQMKELSEECCWIYTENYNGSNVKGVIVYKAKESSDKGRFYWHPLSSYSLSDIHIFLPGSGKYYRSGSFLRGAEGVHDGYYWSSSFDRSLGPAALFYPETSSVRVSALDAGRMEGCSVRAVFK